MKYIEYRINALNQKSSQSLANCPSILEELEQTIHKRKFAGPANIPKLVYLVFLTGLLPKPVSLVIKGPSGAGKSFSLNAGKQFIPKSAYEQFEGMSEKALVYLKDLDLKNRHLVIGEASGMADGSGRTLLRQLLSEGKVRYATVQSTNDGLEGSELPELVGPTGLIMTTTATGLHPEDESRMLSVTMKESAEQIREALMAQAVGSSQVLEELDTKPWYELFELIKSKPKVVSIPFASDIVESLPVTHDRIKRDFPQLLSLITAHAILHEPNRDKTDAGLVVADINDYQAIYELLNEPMSEGLEVTVPDSIRMVVEGVRQIGEASYTGKLSMAKLADHLERDLSVISRNTNKAVKLGYLKNENEGQGREAHLSIGDRKIPTGSVLPAPEELFSKQRLAVAAE